MKNKVVAAFFSIFIIGCSQGVNDFDLKNQNGIWLKNDKPYTGDVYRILKNNKINLGKIKNGKKEGSWIEFGRLIFRTGQYKNGKRVGEWNGWYEDSSKAYSGSYENDLKTGEWNGWNKNGNNTYKGKYNKGKKDSMWYYWFENGQLSDSGKYKEGKMLGEWKYYNEKGVFIEQKTFK